VTGCALVAVSYTYVARYYATNRKPDEKTLWTPSSNHICLAGIAINDLMTDMWSIHRSAKDHVYRTAAVTYVASMHSCSFSFFKGSHISDSIAWPRLSHFGFYRLAAVKL